MIMIAKLVNQRLLQSIIFVSRFDCRIVPTALVSDFAIRKILGLAFFLNLASIMFSEIMNVEFLLFEMRSIALTETCPYS